jgi:hypothetical protein
MGWIAVIIALAGGSSATTATTLHQCELALFQTVDRLGASTIRNAYCQSTVSNDRTYVVRDGKTLP